MFAHHPKSEGKSLEHRFQKFQVYGKFHGKFHSGNSLWNNKSWDFFRDFERFFRWRKKATTSAGSAEAVSLQHFSLHKKSSHVAKQKHAKFHRKWAWSQTSAAKNTLICFFVFLYVSHCFSRELEPRKIGTFSSRIGTFDFTSWLSIWPCHQT